MKTTLINFFLKLGFILVTISLINSQIPHYVTFFILHITITHTHVRFKGWIFNNIFRMLAGKIFQGKWFLFCLKYTCSFCLLSTHQLEQLYPAGPGVGEVFVFELQHERHRGGGVGGSLGSHYRGRGRGVSWRDGRMVLCDKVSHKLLLSWLKVGYIALMCHCFILLK